MAQLRAGRETGDGWSDCLTPVDPLLAATRGIIWLVTVEQSGYDILLDIVEARPVLADPEPAFIDLKRRVKTMRRDASSRRLVGNFEYRHLHALMNAILYYRADSKRSLSDLIDSVYLRWVEQLVRAVRDPVSLIAALESAVIHLA